MYQFFVDSNPLVFYSFIVLVGIVCMFISWKASNFYLEYKSNKIIKKIDEEKTIFQKETKKMWDGEKSDLLEEVEELKSKAVDLNKRLEDYRKKLSGMGMFSFGESKKRSDILYSLIMENELLEQILYDQSKKISEQQKDNLDQRLFDIGKRQRLLAEIFDDKKIKDYVKEVIEEGDLAKTKKLIEK